MPYTSDVVLHDLCRGRSLDRPSYTPYESAQRLQPVLAIIRIVVAHGALRPRQIAPVAHLLELMTLVPFVARVDVDQKKPPARVGERVIGLHG